MKIPQQNAMREKERRDQITKHENNELEIYSLSHTNINNLIINLIID